MRNFLTTSNIVKCGSILRIFSVMANAEKPKVVFVLGGPGAGKGTQCQNIVREFGFVHLSAGDLLREERNKPGSQYGDLIEDHIKKSEIVPVEITLNLILQAMEKSEKKKFLIDGFPRNDNNLEGWDKKMTGKVELLLILFFDCDSEVCVKRCLKRGAEGSGRVDDKKDVLEKRIQTFVNESLPVIKHYEKLNLVRKVDANKSPELVFEDVKVIFQDL
ncbi:cytidine/uridine monophosphate kinase Dak1 [Lycorma delicatula]|uniref:cytidine/uridine monophosphate kinase Dak1 n=1 Tax=Lycorma delicatula TaxID=130591 RepID=UPI003F510FB0